MVLDLQQRRFQIIATNTWFARRFEIDIWVRRQDVGDIWIEVKTISDPEWRSTRVRSRQLKCLREASINLDKTLWLALVDPDKNIEYVDLHSMEPVEC